MLRLHYFGVVRLKPKAGSNRIRCGTSLSQAVPVGTYLQEWNMMEWENLKERGPSHNKLPRVHQGQGRALFVFFLFTFVFFGSTLGELQFKG